MRKINVIVIHHSGSHDTYEKIKELHVKERGWDDVGCHFMVSREGIIIKERSVDLVGAHVKGFNSDSIGIDFLGDFDVKKPTVIQVKAMVRLVKDLMNKYDVLVVKGHREFEGVSKSCPGKNIDMDMFRGLL